jgi:transcriptional regulator with XRE-family HTH domain
MDGFGERLRRLRKEHDITQGQLAEVIGVVPSAVGKYERIPQSYPSVEALIKIADYFNVSTDYLLRGVQIAPSVENNLNGQMLNSSFVQANHGGVVFNGDSQKAISPEAIELLRIYETLGGRDRLKLLNIAVELEGGSK